MKTMPTSIHRWDLSLAEALVLQKQYARQVIRESHLGRVTTVAGVDAGYGQGIARAAVVVLDYPRLNVVDCATATQPVEFPYVPGLLGFREGPVILEALDRLAQMPELLIFDGQGLAHPRRFGLACHIGLLTNTAAIGCAKSPLCGDYEEPGQDKGSYTMLIDKGEIIGAVLRTRTGVKPLFVSIGHRIDLPTAIKYVLDCCPRYRLPETTRWADRIAAADVPVCRSK